MHVLSFDVGICNLAFVIAVVDDDTLELLHIEECCNMDIRNIRHDIVKKQDCTLGHTNTATDWLDHMFQEHPQFDKCSHVFVERQPIHGICSVEQLLFSHFRDRVELISPNAMHKHFAINHLDYEGRKEMTIQMVHDLLPPDRFPEYHQMERKHDVSDAICLLLFWLARAMDTRKKQREREQRQIEYAYFLADHGNSIDSFGKYVNRFRFQGLSNN
ncbi:MAG: hypothetical protein K0U52_00655 [Gammaproteobacteria bacterium]|nr:hypothetical protein [Gammaproteobacteria bacterium]